MAGYMVGQRGESLKVGHHHCRGITLCAHLIMFQVARARFHVSLAPCHLLNPLNGIKAQHLDAYVMRYLPQVRGVVISYSNVEIDKEHGEQLKHVRIADALPFAFFWVNADLVVWRPQRGDELEGVIFTQTATQINLLVHDVFNAVVKAKNMPELWLFVPAQEDEVDSSLRSFGHWQDAEGRPVEGKIAFRVLVLHTNSRMVSLEGTLVLPDLEHDAQPVSGGEE